jgi:hypothetical protein
MYYNYYTYILYIFLKFYSNSDLAKFFELSGLSSASIPVENVYGDLDNDQNDPGGEAQLDVEYIMVFFFFFFFFLIISYFDTSEHYILNIYDYTFLFFKKNNKF